jgi:hypothetical protein
LELIWILPHLFIRPLLPGKPFRPMGIQGLEKPFCSTTALSENPLGKPRRELTRFFTSNLGNRSPESIFLEAGLLSSITG